MKRSWMEWLASMLVVLGVVLIAAADPGMTGLGNLPAFVVGTALLTIGVRLAIECGQARR